MNWSRLSEPVNTNMETAAAETSRNDTLALMEPSGGSVRKAARTGIAPADVILRSSDIQRHPVKTADNCRLMLPGINKKEKQATTSKEDSKAEVSEGLKPLSAEMKEHNPALTGAPKQPDMGRMSSYNIF
eukprot:g2027.t1